MTLKPKRWELKFIISRTAFGSNMNFGRHVELRQYNTDLKRQLTTPCHARAHTPKFLKASKTATRLEVINDNRLHIANERKSICLVSNADCTEATDEIIKLKETITSSWA